MVRYYDNWERLVEAVMRREQFRQLSLSESRSPSARSFDSDFSFSTSSSQLQDLSFRTTPSPLHPDDALRLKLGQSVKEVKQSSIGKLPPKGRGPIWKGLSIFGGFSSKKDHRRKELFSKQKKIDEVLAEEMKRTAEIARFREMYTLRGHIEAIVKRKRLDIDPIHHYYTI